MRIINCTPHVIVMNDGTSFPPSGSIARVSSSHVNSGDVDGIPVYTVVYGAVENLPDPIAGTIYIVSAMVLSGTDRDDVVAPATGHPQVVREAGQIISVPGFVKKGGA